jgi:predicted AAA+ superfamily ATPase
MVEFLPRRVEATARQYLTQFPVVAIVGPRQSGKSTLARQILAAVDASLRLDLELPSDINRLRDPEAFLRSNAGVLVCLDEVQRVPDIFPVVRALVDEDRRPGRFLMLGSASPHLLRQSTETLAGRIAYIDLTPFGLDEVGPDHLQTHWMRGGFPESFLAPSDEASLVWRQQFVRTFVEGDLPALGIDLTTSAVSRLWQMLASGSGSLLNRTKLADPVGVSPQTIARYIDILEATFMIGVLRPRLPNTKKRLVRAPKLYVRDTGLLHALLGIETFNNLYGHMAIGASWESYVVEQLRAGLPDWNASFYRTSGGAEIDLVLERGGRRIAVEAKSSSAPRVSRGFYEAAEDIGATDRFVVAPLSRPDGYPIGRETVVCSPDWLLSFVRNTTVHPPK